MADDDWVRQRKIARIASAVYTPDVLLAQFLEMARAGKLRNVYVSVQWESDETFSASWSNMCTSELACHGMLAHQKALNQLVEGGQTYYGPAPKSTG